MAEKKNSSKKNSKASGETKEKGKAPAKKAASKKSQANTSKRITAKEKKELENKKSFMIREAAFVLVCFLSLFLFLSNFGLLGSVGGFFSRLQKGLFGMAGYCFPICLIILVGFTVKMRHTSVFWLKFGAGIMLFLVLTAILHMAFGTEELLTFSEYYDLAGEGTFFGGAAGGGVGGIFAGALIRVIARVGAWMLLFAIAITCVVILSEKSIINAARKSAEKASEAAIRGSESAGRRLKEEKVRLEARREARILKQKEDAFERDINAQSVMPPLNSDTFDLKKERAKQMDAFADEYNDGEGQQPDFERTVTLNRADLPDQSTADIMERNAEQKEGPILENNGGSNLTPDSRRNADASLNPDYSDDSVPFTETAQEKYIAYGRMLSNGTIDMKAARQMGFAVSSGEEAETIQQTRAATKDEKEERENREERVEIEERNAHYEAFRDEFREYLHRPLNPDEIEYPNVAQPDLTDDINREETNPEGLSFAGTESHDQDLQEQPLEDLTIVDLTDEPEEDYTEESEAFTKAIEPEYTAQSDERTGTIEQDRTHHTIPPDYDELFHITDEDRNDVYDAREKAAKEDTAAEPFTRDTISSNVKNKQPAKKTEQSAGGLTESVKNKPRPYRFPPVSLLAKGEKTQTVDTDDTRVNAGKLQKVLAEFGVGVTVTNVVKGPRVTRYELAPDIGVKVSRITALAGDLKLALAASDLRIEAPIPGKSAVGIEVPNKESATVLFRDIMDTPQFKGAKSKLTWGVGLDIQGSPVVGDITKMPHLLVAGTTGSGKSVGINSIIMSVIYRATPEEVRMILVDPKVVELSVYDGIPHLLAPVVTKPEAALAVLNKACAEMNYRYNLFKESGTRNIAGYNEKVEEVCKTLPEGSEKPQKLPYILIIIDELSELMMHSKKDVESAIVSLTQLARAAGIHLVVATQRPSVDVVTGLIKSNIPSRVAYKLPSGTDSRTVLDSYGADKLLGNGDMLYKPGDKNSPLRVQGAFLSDGEVESVVEWLKKNNGASYDDEWKDLKAPTQQTGTSYGQGEENSQYDDGRDSYFLEAGALITEKKKASIGLLQRKFKIGFNRASRIMDQLCEAGVVSEGEGTKERLILMTPEEFRGSFS